ncbi:hypothetical protein ACHAPT_013528, partial [Fusarium lateritium]
MANSPRESDHTLFNDCVDRGRRLWAALKTRLGSDAPDEELQPYGGMYLLTVEPDALNPLELVEESILEDLGELPSLKIWTSTELRSWDSDGVAYHNYMDRTGRALLCAFNDKSWDKNDSDRMPFDNILARVVADVTTRDTTSKLQW